MFRYLCVFLAIVSNTAFAEVFKWVDHYGKTHYSDTPPPSNPRKDLSKKLEAPPCDIECKVNVQNQNQYRQQHTQERQRSEAKQRADLESSIRYTQQIQAAQDAKKRQEHLKGQELLRSESRRIPSNNIRTR